MNVRKVARFPRECLFREPVLKGCKEFMKTIRFRLLAATLAVMLGAAIAKSQTADAPAPPPSMHEHAWGMGHEMGFFAKYLNLTDDQKAQMKAVMQKERPTMKPLMQQERQLDLQLRGYVEGTYDDAKVQALVSQQAQNLVQLKVQETRIHNELFQLLTPDQQAKMKQFEANREARMQQHMQPEPASAPEE
jgi:periplasmic protein CpxP/Spy